MVISLSQPFTRDKMLEALNSDGYVVLRGAVSTTACDAILELFFDYLEALCPRFKRGDRTTWTNKNLPLNTRGLIQYFGVGFQKYAIDARMALKYIFAELFGTDMLTSSFDGTSFTVKKNKRPVFADLADFTKKCWEDCPVHIDQTLLNEELGKDFMSIQSGLCIVDQEEDGHVFTCIPGSHALHKKVLKIGKKAMDKANRKIDRDNARLKTMSKAEVDEENARLLAENPKAELLKKRAPKKQELHWLVMNPKHMKYFRDKKKLCMVRVHLKKGDVVLWRSNLVHSSAGYCKSAAADAIRLQIFVAMRPALTVGDSDKAKAEIANRKRAFDGNKVSKHSADEIRLFEGKPRMYGVADNAQYEEMNARVPKPPKMNDEQLRLHGLLAYEPKRVRME